MRTTVLLLSLALAGGCVKPVCYNHDDCDAGKVCGAGGDCVVPECTDHSQCTDGKVCEGFACVAGCVEEADCGPGFTCSENRCVPLDSRCSCPLAPSFCLTDVNPASESAGKAVCPAEEKGAAQALFFGSVACPSCHLYFKDMQALRDQLVGEGLEVRLLMVNLKSVALDSEAVGSLMSFATEAILQDRAEDDVWGLFSADWYELVVFDRNGCLAGHFDLQNPAFTGESGLSKIANAWRQAALAECRGERVDVRTPDIREQEELSTPEEIGPPPEEVLLELPEPVDSSEQEQQSPPDLTGELSVPDQVADLAEVDLTEPFILDDLCQVVQAGPIVPGDKMPHFLCRDRNSSSPTFGAGVSELTMKSLVWIAYAGACT